MNNRPKRNLKAVLRAIKANRGMMYKTAESLEVSPRTLATYAKRHPTIIQAAIDEARGFFVDTAEHKLIDAVDDGQPWAVMFTLRTVGKHRGYMENLPSVTAEIHVNPYGAINNRIIAQLGDGTSAGNTGEGNGDANEG